MIIGQLFSKNTQPDSMLEYSADSAGDIEKKTTTQCIFPSLAVIYTDSYVRRDIIVVYFGFSGEHFTATDAIPAKTQYYRTSILLFGDDGKNPYKNESPVPHIHQLRLVCLPRTELEFTEFRKTK